MSIGIPGLHFVVQAIDHTATSLIEDGSTNQCSVLLNTTEAAYAGWYGGSAGLVDNYTLGVTPGCHFMLAVYSTNPSANPALVDIRLNKYRFTLENQWSNTGNYDANNFYQFTPHKTQIANGEFMQLDGAYNTPTHYFRDNTQNPDHQNASLYSSNSRPLGTDSEWAIIPASNENVIGYQGDDLISADVNINLFTRSVFGLYDQKYTSNSTTDYTSIELSNYRKQIFITKTPCLAQNIQGIPTQPNAQNAVDALDYQNQSFNLKIEYFNGNNWEHTGTIDNIIRTRGQNEVPNHGAASNPVFNVNGIFYGRGYDPGGNTGAFITRCRCHNPNTAVTWPNYHTSCETYEWEIKQGHIWVPQNEQYSGQDHVIDFKTSASGVTSSFSSIATDLIPWYINKWNPGTASSNSIASRPYSRSVFDNIMPLDITISSLVHQVASSLLPTYDSAFHITQTEWPTLNNPSNVYNYGMLGQPGAIPGFGLWKSILKNTNPGATPYPYNTTGCIGAPCSTVGGDNTLNYLDPNLYSFAFQYINKENSGPPSSNNYNVGDTQFNETGWLGTDKGAYHGTYPITTGNFDNKDAYSIVTGFVYNSPRCPTNTEWNNGISFQGVQPAGFAEDSGCTLRQGVQGSFTYDYDGSLGTVIEVRNDNGSGAPDMTPGGLITTVQYTGTNVIIDFMPTDILTPSNAFGDMNYEYWFVSPSSGCAHYVEQYLPAVAEVDCSWPPVVQGQLNCPNGTGSCPMIRPSSIIWPVGSVRTSTMWTMQGILMNGGTQNTGCKTTTSSFNVLIQYGFHNITQSTSWNIVGTETIVVDSTDCASLPAWKGNVGGNFVITSGAAAGDVIMPYVDVRGHAVNGSSAYGWAGYSVINGDITLHCERKYTPTQVVPAIVTSNFAFQGPMTVTDPECSDDTGQILAIFQNGGGPYYIQLISGNGATSNNGSWTFTLNSSTGEWVGGAIVNHIPSNIQLVNLKGNNTYTVRITDMSTGCCIEGDAVLGGVDDITINSLTGTDPTTCAGVNGTITANVSTTCTTMGAITYVWSAIGGGAVVPSGQTNTQNPVGLTAGIYQLQATDPCGCIDTDTITLSDGSGLWNLGFSNIHPSECDLCLGVIGIYINEPTLLTGIASYTLDSCTNCGTTAGQLPVTFNIPSSTATAWFFETFNQGASSGFSPPGICADSGSSPGSPAVYTITFNDGAGCTQTQTTNLYSGGSHTVSPAVITCIGCLGATCSLTGPIAVNPPAPYNSSCHVRYNYWLSETNYFGTLTPSPTNIIGPQTSMNFTGLLTGVTYYLVVEDIMTTNCADHADMSSHYSSCRINNGTYTSTGASLPTVSLTFTPPPCYNGGTGGVVMTAVGAGGTPPYTYDFTLSSGTSTGFNTLNTVGFAISSPCNHGPLQTVDLLDANGCTATATVNIPCLPTALEIPPGVNISDASCTNPQVADGIIGANAAIGGTPPYTYQWYTNAGLTVAATGTGHNTIQYSAALPGNYWFKVTDSNGCIDSSGPHTVAQGLCDLCLTAVKTDITCGGANGTINLTVDGSNICGTAGHSFTYAWTGPGAFTATTQDLTGLSVSGNYIVTVTDTTTGETDSLTIFVGGGADIPEVLTLTTVPPDCPGGCDGAIGVQCLAGDFPLNIRVSTIYSGVGDLLVANYVTVQGGPFTSLQMGGGQPYLWLCPDSTCDATQHSGSANFHSTSGVTNFCFVEGTTYYFQSVGANSCLSDVYSIIQATHVAIPIVLTETIIQPTCCGCTNSGCASCNCNGSISVTVTGGNTNPPALPWSSYVFEYDELSNGTFIDITSDFTQAGNVFTTGIFVMDVSTNNNSLGLYPGTYRFTITDGCGISATETYVLTDPKVYVANITTTDVTCLNGCQDGSITVEAYGGNSGFLEFSVNGGLTWSAPVATGVLVISGVTYSNAAAYTFTLLLPGGHDIWVRDTSPCNPPTYADPNDISLCASGCLGCYADYIFANHHINLNALSSLTASVLSFNNISLIGGSDGEIEISITGGVEPYDISISCHTALTGYANCLNQGLPIPAGLAQFINLNGVNIDASGITGAQDFGSSIGQPVTLNTGNVLEFTNLSLANDLSTLATTGSYRIIIQDAEGCLAVLNQELENGLRNYLNLYGAEDCNCNCPPGYVYQDPDGIPNSGDENCDGEASVQPDYNGSVGTIGSIRQFIAPVNIPGSIVSTYSFSTPAWYTDASLLPITILLGNTFYLHEVTGLYQFDNAGGDILTPGPLPFSGNIFTVGGTGWSRLWDNGIWLSGQNLAPVATPVAEWLYIIVEVAFTAPIQTILAVACDGIWTFDIDCNPVITNENVGGNQNALEELQGHQQYSLFTLGLPQGQYTLKFGVKNPSLLTVPTNILAPAGISFDLFQGFTSGGIDVLTILSTANIGDDIDQYLINDINNVPISSKSHGPIYSDNVTGLDVPNPYFNTMGSVTGQLYGEFLSSYNILNPTSSIYGHICSSGCLQLLNGELVCVVSDDQDCVLPLDCGYCSDPAYVSQTPCEDAGGTWTTDDGILSDLVECIGTMTNILYSKLASGLIDNTLCIQDVWKVILIKYLIKNLNSCITAEDLVSWAKFLEDLCPSCNTELIVNDEDVDITPTNSDFDF